MDLKESLEKEEQKRNSIRTLSPLYPKLQDFELFIKTINYKELINASYKKIEELECTFILLIVPTPSLLISNNNNTQSNELYRIIDLAILLRKNAQNSKIVLYTITDYASQVEEIKEEINKNEIIKKIISRITDNPIKNLSMAISSVTNKYFLNQIKHNKKNILKVYVFNSNEVTNAETPLSYLKELIKSPYSDIIDVSLEMNPTNSVIENDINILNGCLSYSKQIKQIIDEIHNEDNNLFVSKIDTFIKLLRKVHFSWKKVMSKLEHNELKEVQLQKLDDIAFYEYISDDYIKNMKEKFFPSESIEEILSLCKNAVSQLDSIESKNEIISSLISNGKKAISFIQTVNDLLLYILSNINDDIAQFQSMSQQYLDN